MMKKLGVSNVPELVRLVAKLNIGLSEIAEE